MNVDDLDGRIGEGWSGEVAERLARQRRPRAPRKPDARLRRSPCFAHPAPGHTPVLVCVGATPAEYEPVWPPTLMMNKGTALDDRHQTLTWGAAQLGIAQGVLDAVADGLLETDGETIVLVAVWVDPVRTTRPPSGSRIAPPPARRSASASRVATRMRRGRSSSAATRCRARTTAVTECASLRSRRGGYRYPLDPPFLAAWDPSRAPTRTRPSWSSAPEDGVEGYASGDGVPDRELLEHLLLGADATDSATVHAVLETVDFHHGRNWTVEVADLGSRRPSARRAGVATARRDARPHPRLRVDG